MKRGWSTDTLGDNEPLKRVFITVYIQPLSFHLNLSLYPKKLPLKISDNCQFWVLARYSENNLNPIFQHWQSQSPHTSWFNSLYLYFWGIQGIPSESWRPGLSENVVVFVAIIFWTRIMAGWSWVKFQRKKIVEWNRTKKRHGYNFAFQASILNQRLPNRYVLMLIQWQNLKRKIVAVSFFCTVSYFC